MPGSVFDDGDGVFVSGGIRILAGGDDAHPFPLGIADTTVPPGFPGPVRHRHAAMHDIFYILEGALRFEIDGEERTLTRGGFAMVPPGVAHTFSNPHPEPARFLNLYSPAGLERYVIEIAKRMAAGSVPTQDEMRELVAGHDFEAVDDL